jgi:hypothetical protein
VKVRCRKAFIVSTVSVILGTVPCIFTHLEKKMLVELDRDDTSLDQKYLMNMVRKLT